MQPRELARPNLEQPDFNRILHVHMTALDAVGTPEDPGPGLIDLVHGIPDHTVALRELAVELSARQVERDRSAGSTPDLARSLNNLSNRLRDLGHREEALSAVRQAVDTYRLLILTQPDAFLPNLAGSLNNLSNRLRDLGRREEALSVCQEAVDMWRSFAQAQPDGLATSLDNLSICLANLGRPEEALSACHEATDIRRSLAEAQPDVFLPDLATSLNNLTGCLVALPAYT